MFTSQLNSNLGGDFETVAYKYHGPLGPKGTVIKQEHTVSKSGKCIVTIVTGMDYIVSNVNASTANCTVNDVTYEPILRELNGVYNDQKDSQAIYVFILDVKKGDKVSANVNLNIQYFGAGDINFIFNVQN